MIAGNARQGALLALLAVCQRDQRLEPALESSLQKIPEARDRALARELSYGVLRYKIRLEALVGQLLKRPLKARDYDLNLCIQLGLYQILHTRIPAHAAVKESVELVPWLRKDWARGLVNGVLRRFLREHEVLTRRVDLNEQVRMAHPAWLYSAIAETWPEQLEQILTANNTHPPLSLRVNSRRQNREQYQAILTATGLDSEITLHSAQGLRLAKAIDVSQIPGFSTGQVSVQDEAAQLAAGLLDLKPGQRILDACAAPGGKTAHILETEPDVLNLLALESDQLRMARLASGLQRLDLAAELRCADVRQTVDWWQGQSFDRILLDAPCSATGVIRRHPDIRHRRTPGQLRQHAQLQWQLLQSLWPTLARGGKLVYATCSIMPQENHQLIQEFLAARADAVALPMHCGWGRAVAPGRQILCGDDNMDGFYYAVLGKQS